MNHETVAGADSSAATSSKEDFVLSFPTDMPVRDIIAKGKEQGIDISESYAYKVRRGATKKGKAAGLGKAKPARGKAPKAAKAAKAAKPAKAAKATAPKAAKKSVTKRDFVLKFPSDMPAADVVAEAVKAGVDLKVGYVHEVRSSVRKKGSKPGKPGRPRKNPAPAAAAPAPKAPRASKAGKAAASPAASEAVSDDVKAFRTLVLKLGFVQAQNLLSDLQSRYNALVNAS